MRVSKEFLMEAFGLTLTVAFILIGVQLFQRAEKIVLLLEQEQNRTITELEEYELTKYDGLCVDGITAVGYIKSVMDTHGVPITVQTNKGSFAVQKSEYSSLRNMNSEYYMNPMAFYLCEVFRDENGAISEIGITMEMKGEQ